MKFAKAKTKIKQAVRSRRKIVHRTFFRSNESSTEEEKTGQWNKLFRKVSSKLLKHKKNESSYVEQNIECIPGTLCAIHGNKMTLNSFQLVRLVGKGSFGKVFLALHKQSNQYFAIKMFEKDDIISKQQVQHTLTERNIMSTIKDGPFLAQMKSSFHDVNRLYIVSKFYSGGELFFHLRNAQTFSETLVRLYVAEIACALQFLHERNIVFRDLKSENLLLDTNGHIVLTDFGLARENVSELSGAKSVCGTVAYVAPEMILSSKNGKEYGTQVDWWALGTLCYDFLIGQPPFAHENTRIMCQRIVDAKLKFPRYVNISRSCRLFIADLLSANPHERLGCSSRGGFQSIQNHPFFESLGKWDANTLKKVVPEFLPRVKGASDVRNFDCAFTKLRPSQFLSTSNNSSYSSASSACSSSSGSPSNKRSPKYKSPLARSASMRQRKEMDRCVKTWDFCDCADVNNLEVEFESLDISDDSATTIDSSDDSKNDPHVVVIGEETVCAA